VLVGVSPWRAVGNTLRVRVAEIHEPVRLAVTARGIDAVTITVDEEETGVRPASSLREGYTYGGGEKTVD